MDRCERILGGLFEGSLVCFYLRKSNAFIPELPLVAEVEGKIIE